MPRRPRRVRVTNSGDAGNVAGRMIIRPYRIARTETPRAGCGMAECRGEKFFAPKRLRMNRRT